MLFLELFYLQRLISYSRKPATVDNAKTMDQGVKKFRSECNPTLLHQNVLLRLDFVADDRSAHQSGSFDVTGVKKTKN